MEHMVRAMDRDGPKLNFAILMLLIPWKKETNNRESRNKDINDTQIERRDSNN
jgi:hypothetical protein